MMHSFSHSFHPASENPVLISTISLSVTQIEDAGLYEVLQTPGAALGSWAILDTLLESTVPFSFKAPLGQAREVKVALSGLFGRFIARAYLQKYFHLSIFAHLGKLDVILDRRRAIKVIRRRRGDLPDWVTCRADLTHLTIAEAKGCHDRSGPAQALGRAWAQANRVRVTFREEPVTVKRIAIATRWGSGASHSDETQISVHDPEERGRRLTKENESALYIGLARLHMVNLLTSLGHQNLASTLRDLTVTSGERRKREALQVLESTPAQEVERGPVDEPIDVLIGGYVTRAGPILESRLSKVDEDTLWRLNLRPVFVGVEREILRALVMGEAEKMRVLLSETTRKDEIARFGSAGSWIIPLGPEGRSVSGS